MQGKRETIPGECERDQSTADVVELIHPHFVMPKNKFDNFYF